LGCVHAMLGGIVNAMRSRAGGVQGGERTSNANLQMTYLSSTTRSGGGKGLLGAVSNREVGGESKKKPLGGAKGQSFTGSRKTRTNVVKKEYEMKKTRPEDSIGDGRRYNIEKKMQTDERGLGGMTGRKSANKVARWVYIDTSEWGLAE